MSQLNLIIEATQQDGRAIKTTVSHMRKNQIDKAAQLAQALNGFTLNRYDGQQVNELDVDIYESQNLPQEISVTYQQASSTYVYTVHRLGTGNVTVYSGGSSITVDQTTGTFSYNGAGPFIILVDADNTYAQGYYVYTRT